MGKYTGRAQQQLRKSTSTNSRQWFENQPQQIQICINKIVFNGHVLSAEGISLDPEKIKSVNQLQVDCLGAAIIKNYKVKLWNCM